VALRERRRGEAAELDVRRPSGPNPLRSAPIPVSLRPRFFCTVSAPEYYIYVYRRPSIFICISYLCVFGRRDSDTGPETVKKKSPATRQ
jgi:hypothetical protein